MSRRYYCYQISLPGSEGVDVYVGRATSKARALSHLAGSHNAKLATLLEKATTWPLIDTMALPQSCMGDLAVMEAALIEDLRDRSIGAGRQAPVRNILNSRSEQGARWLRPGINDDDHPEGLGPLVSDDNGDWQLYTWPLCHRDENAPAILSALDQSREVASGRPLPSREQGFSFLPDAGEPIERVDLHDLRLRLDSDGIGTALLVHVNATSLSDGRDALGPESSQEDLTDRVVRTWPLSKKLAAHYRDAPPQCVIGTFGAPAFRLVLGAWHLEREPDAVDTGDWTSAGEIAGFRGLVLDPEVRFGRHSYSLHVLDPSGAHYDSRAQKIRSIQKPH